MVETRGLAYDFGLLGDALIEQGKTDEAALAYQKMMETRPGPEAYGRAARLRWLKGDIEGARALMLLSAQSAGQTESAAWAWSKLAMYELHAGDVKRARAACDASLRMRSAYAPGLFSRARSARRKQSRRSCRRARARSPTQPAARVSMGAGRRAERREPRRRRRGGRTADRRHWGGERSPFYSLFLATRGRDPDLALRLAEEELKVRRDVYTLDALAWAQSAKGDAAEGWKTMQTALALGTADARIYLHAAAIGSGRRKQTGKIYAHGQVRLLVAAG